MTGKNSFKIFTKKKTYLVKAGLRYLLPVFAFFFFLGPHSSLFANTPSPDFGIKGQLNIISFPEISSSNNSPLHLPFQVESVAEELQDTDENDSHEKVDNEWDLSHCNMSADSRFNFDDAKKLLAQLTLSEENQAAVPLFVLYHSWKSYLS